MKCIPYFVHVDGVYTYIYVNVYMTSNDVLYVYTRKPKHAQGIGDMTLEEVIKNSLCIRIFLFIEEYTYIYIHI